MGSEVPILEFSTGPLVGRGSWPVGAGTHLQCPTLRASQGPGGRPVTQLSFSPRSTQGPVDNHVAGKGPRQGAAAPEVHQDHEGTFWSSFHYSLSCDSIQGFSLSNKLASHIQALVIWKLWKFYEHVVHASLPYLTTRSEPLNEMSFPILVIILFSTHHTLVLDMGLERQR